MIEAITSAPVWLHAVAFVGIATLILNALFGRSSKYPPGPRGLPLVGVATRLGKYPERNFKKWSLEEYGPVMSINVLGRKGVVLNTYDVMKEAFLDKDDVTANRGVSFIFTQLQGYTGLTFVDWNAKIQNQKRFAVEFFKSLGVDGIDEVVNYEVTKFLSFAEANTEKPIEFTAEIFNISSNVLSTLLFGKRHETDDPTAEMFFSVFDNLFGAGNNETKHMFAVELRPWLRHFGPFKRAFNKTLEKNQQAMDWYKSNIAETRENLDSEGSNYYVKQYVKEQRNGDTKKDFSDEQLLGALRDLCGAGLKSIGNTLNWVVLCALLNDESREKLVEEIDRVLGPSKVPTSTFVRNNMPYTCAFIEEVLRLVCPVHKIIDHVAHSDVEIGGYVIPKGTRISGNLWGAHHDAETFPDPEKFLPSRHLLEDGSFNKENKVMMFGVGSRYCLGETTARSQLYLLTTRLFQNFKLTPTFGDPKPTHLNGILRINYDPLPYKVTFKKRDHADLNSNQIEIAKV